MRKIDTPPGYSLVPRDCLVATAEQRRALSIGEEDAGKLILQKDTNRMYLATLTEGAKDLTASHAAEHAAMGLPFKFPNFRRSLLPSLVAGATASRSAGVVTIAATAHGITTGSPYQGFRVFYPGSPGLAAGWYDAILSVPDANTLTFSAPGPDFGSESVNGGAAYTLSTDFCLLTVPGGLVQPGSSIRLSALWGGDATAALKSQRMRIGSTSVVVRQTSTAPHCEVTSVLRIGENLQTQYIGSAENAAVVNINAYSFDFSGDVAIGVAGTLPSAGTFLTLYGASARVEI